MNQDRKALVLIVDPQVGSRHWLWRMLNHAFGVIEASSASGARRWIAERPDIDAMIVEDELPDARGSDLIRELVQSRHPAASRSILIASDWRHVMLSGINVVSRGEVRSIAGKLVRLVSDGLVQDAIVGQRARAVPPTTVNFS